MTSKKSNGHAPRHVLVLGEVEFEDAEFSGAQVILLDDRILDWAYFGGQRDPSAPRDLIEAGLTVSERFELLTRLLNAKTWEIIVDHSDLPPAWTFANLVARRWEIFDFADYVNQKAVGKPAIPWS